MLKDKSTKYAQESNLCLTEINRTKRKGKIRNISLNLSAVSSINYKFILVTFYSL